MSLLNHGGRLRQAAIDYQIPLTEWIDLSTGVSPWTYPVSSIDPEYWNRLPEVEDGLEQAARDYYQCSSLLPVAGSQAAIQILPLIWRQHLLINNVNPSIKPLRVGLPYQGYKEHEQAWRKAGWEVFHYRDIPEQNMVDELAALVVINPNNPTAFNVEVEQLLQWRHQLAQRQGVLVVDEAFADADGQQSLSKLCPLNNLVVLRSVGKFFGLAGVRVGFVLANNDLLTLLAQALGPWTIAGPSRQICAQALQNTPWQAMQLQRLNRSSRRLYNALVTFVNERNENVAASVEEASKDQIKGTSLFQTLYCPNAKAFHHALCQQGILVRLTDECDGLRFGLPHNEAQWQRLGTVLTFLEIDS
jgi:cobalamin biosynthetic protein CobC